MEKYDFIQILTVLRDEKTCLNCSQVLHDIITDLMEMDQAKIKEKYNLF